MRIYINNFADPAKIWRVDNGPGTRSRYYAKVHFNPELKGLILDQNLKAPEGEAKAWVYIDKAFIYFQRTETRHGVEAYILPRY